MSKLRVTASPDGQSETQTLEVKVRSHDEEDEEPTRERGTIDFLETDILSLAAKVSADREKRRSREVSPRDPAISTTFVRGSSGRSSWRMVPNSKRRSGASEDEGQSAGGTNKYGIQFLCPVASSIWWWV